MEAVTAVSAGGGMGGWVAGGGGRGVTIANRRVFLTSLFRACVGRMLQLNWQIFSPCFSYSFDTDPDPRIRTTGLRIRIRILLFSLVAFKIPTENKFFLAFYLLGILEVECRGPHVGEL